MNVTIFKSLFDNSTAFPVQLEQVVDRIRNGKSKDIVEKIRKAEGSEKDELKKQSVVILFAGEFTHRNAKSLKKHSGLMVIDYDKCPDAIWDEIIEIPSVVLAFRSPSGQGLNSGHWRRHRKPAGGRRGKSVRTGPERYQPCLRCVRRLLIHSDRAADMSGGRSEHRFPSAGRSDRARGFHSAL